jgi:hypothetical protein
MEQQPEPLEPEAALTNRIIDIAKPKPWKPKKNTKRVVVNTKVWNFTPDELNPLYQPSIVRELYDYTHTHATTQPRRAGYNALDAKKNKFIHQQINNKIRGIKPKT